MISNILLIHDFLLDLASWHRRHRQDKTVLVLSVWTRH